MRRRRRYARPLRELYAELNAQLFGGRLPAGRSDLVLGGPVETRGVLVRRVAFRLADQPRERGRSVRDWGAPMGLLGEPGCVGWFRPPGAYWPATIHVAAPLVPGLEREVLAHEMCHAALFFDGFPEEDHGPRFVAELERLAALGEGWAREEAARYTGERPAEEPGR